MEDSFHTVSHKFIHIHTATNIISHISPLAWFHWLVVPSSVVLRGRNMIFEMDVD